MRTSEMKSAIEIYSNSKKAPDPGWLLCSQSATGELSPIANPTGLEARPGQLVGSWELRVELGLGRPRWLAVC